MTTLAVKVYKDKIIIGADSLITTENAKEEFKQINNNMKKITKIGVNFGYAFAGSLKEHLLFLEFINIGNRPNDSNTISILDYLYNFIEWKNIYSEVELENNYLIYFKGKIFFYSDGDGCFEIDNYYATGSGEKYAMSALYLGQEVKTAVEVACTFDLFSGGEIQIIEFRR